MTELCAWVVVAVALLLTVMIIKIVIVSLGSMVPTVTLTVRAAGLVATVPLVLVAPEISRNEEKVSVTRVLKEGAVPLLVMVMRKVKRPPARASLGLTDKLELTLGVSVPVAVGVGGVPVTVGVGVEVSVEVGVEVGGVPVTVGVGVPVSVAVAVGVGVSVEVGVGVSVTVTVGVSVEVAVGVSVSSICAGSPLGAAARAGLPLGGWRTSQERTRKPIPSRTNHPARRSLPGPAGFEISDFMSDSPGRRISVNRVLARL